MMQMSYCCKRPYRCRTNGQKWSEWRDELYEGLDQFVASPEPWRYDFELHKEPSPGHYEQSYLSRLTLKAYLEGVGFPYDVCFDPDSRYLTIKLQPEETENLFAPRFYMDVMNNPNPARNNKLRLAYAWDKSGSYQEAAPFKDVYHTIGNFGLLPEWLRSYDDCLNNVHGRSYGDRWDAFLKFDLLERFKNRHAISDFTSISFKDYVKYNCLYQYIDNCPPIEDDWASSSFAWSDTLKKWDEWLFDETTQVEIISLLDGKPLDERWPNEPKQLRGSKDVALCEVDKRIRNLIEVRGRCIVAIARTQLQ